MSNISANVVVDPSNVNIQVGSTDTTVVVQEPVQLAVTPGESISANLNVQTNDLSVNVEPVDASLNVSPTLLNVFTGGFANPGGVTGQLQYNDGTGFAGVPNVTWDGANLNLGNFSNVKLFGGDNGFVLQTDGTGNLTWTAQTGGGGGGNGVPGGANTQIQYNDSGAFGGDPGFTYNENTDTLNVVNSTMSSIITNGLILNATSFGLGNNSSATFTNSVAIGPDAETTDEFGVSFGDSATAGRSAVSIGRNSSATDLFSVAIGDNATIESAPLGFNGAIAIGYNAYAPTEAVSIGKFAGDAGGPTLGRERTVAIGSEALRQVNPALGGRGAIAIGYKAGFEISEGAIAIGDNAGANGTGEGAIAIGDNAGNNNQGVSSIAVGKFAGLNSQANNSIAINATGSTLDAPTANALFVKPIRDVTGEAGFTVQLYYNPSTGEIGFK